MKRALIFCNGREDDYTLEKQVEAFCREAERLNDLVVVEIPSATDDYEAIDEAIEGARKSGCTGLAILHEDDFKYEAFERACLQEYGKAFDSIDIYPKRSSRQIREAGPIAGGLRRVAEAGAIGGVAAAGAAGTAGAAPATQGQAPQQAPQSLASIYVFLPFNAQVKGTADAIGQFQGSDAYKALVNKDTAGQVQAAWYQPQNLRNVCFQMSPEEGLKKFINGETIAKAFEKAQSIQNDQELKKMYDAGGATLQMCYHPASINMDTFKAAFGSSTQLVPYKCSAPNVNASKKLFDLASKIFADIKGKKVKANPDQIKKYAGTLEKKADANQKVKNVKIEHCLYLIKEVEQNRKNYKGKNVSGDTREKQKSDFLKDLAQSLGMDKDYQTAKNNLERGGLGLAVSGAEFIKKRMDKAGKEKPKNDKKDDEQTEDTERDMMLSHPNFPALYDLLDDENRYFVKGK